MGETIPEEWRKESLRDCLQLLTDFEANGSFATVKENVSILNEPSFSWYVSCLLYTSPSPRDS